MNVSDIVSLISNVGFPIVVAIAMFWWMVKEGREQRKVIENNTIMLNRILEHLSGGEEVGE